MRKCHLLIILVLLPLCISAKKQFSVTSPNKSIEVTIGIDQHITYSIKHLSETVLYPSSISMELGNNISWGIGSKIVGSESKSVKETISSSIYKRKKITDNYNQLTLRFKDGFNLIFRAYDDGVAYRFVSTREGSLIVVNEEANFDFGTDKTAYIPYVRKNVKTIEEQFFNTFENTYTYQKVNDWKQNQLSLLPLLVDINNGKKACIVEADLEDYPGMYLIGGDSSQPGKLKGMFPPYPKKEEQGGHINSQVLVKEREPFIAKSEGKRNFPWRIIVISGDDKHLADNDIVYKLAAPSRIEDTSWIKPGKVAWDWWNDWGLYDVDFKAGVNNETYKYYIDFASKFGIEYVILDEGWSVSRQADLFKIVPEINLKELIDYATSKNVNLILWAGYYAFARDLEKVCKHYSEMGIKGFKIDFMDRDDQKMVSFHYEAARIAAKYNLLVDFHGSYKPTGLNRTYPNVINFEGVHGLEQLKFDNPLQPIDQVTYDVTIPFIRQIAGPMDYTQGAMRNATKDNFKSSYSEPMSQGTRCRQLAQYVIFESPLNMLCDSPSNYIENTECTEFIAKTPTIWDETIPLCGKIGEYVTLARKSGDVWYLGAMTNWDKRTLNIDLSFLDGDNWIAEIFMDGINANKIARDYQRVVSKIPQNKIITISMASGGGYAMKIYKDR